MYHRMATHKCSTIIVKSVSSHLTVTDNCYCTIFLHRYKFRTSARILSHLNFCTLNQPLHWMITYIYALSYACMTGTFYCTKDNCNTICYISSPTILILFSENNPLVRLTWWCPCCVTC